MSHWNIPPNRRILVIDDNHAVHQDFAKILCPAPPAGLSLDDFESDLFGDVPCSRPRLRFDVESAYQGEEGLAMVRHAVEAGKPYATAFVDVRMPPGWDGIETVSRIWDVDPDLQVVICSAYSDYTWEQTLSLAGHSDRMLILKKPFDPIEAQQLAVALTEKWRLLRESKCRVSNLENMVSTRSAELEAEVVERKQLEEQFRQAQKMEAFGQLAGGVAHDFNNILAVITGYTSLILEKDALEAETRDQIEQVLTAADRAANLTRQLLTFSRKKELQVRSLNLNDVLGEVTRMLSRLIGEDVELNCRFAHRLPRIDADAGMMEQVVMNLGINARDAMPNGGRLLISTETVTIDETHARSHPDARTGDFVCLSLKDSGCGMTPEIQGRIFEPFFTTKGAGKGTGLGLATVFGIVKQHEGWIEVESQPGQGTIFRIFIPVSARSAPQHQTTSFGSRSRAGTESILLVEDDAAVRGMSRLILQGNGYCVLEASTGVEALSVWSESGANIDLLLTDMVMPDGITGSQLAEQLLARKPGLKVICSSGYSGDILGTAFSGDHALTLLQKPYNPRKLLETVRECLDGPPDCIPRVD